MIYLRVGYSKNVGSIYSIFVRWDYTPAYHNTYVNLVKSTSKRCFNSEQKEWEVAYECYTELISKLNNLGIEYNGVEFVQQIEEFKKEVQKNLAIQENNIDIDTSILDGIKFKTEPRSYQKEGIAFGLSKNSFLLADEQGLGKSLQCLNIASLKKIGKHCLIIVGYDSLQYNWIAEIEKHTNEKGHVLGQCLITKGKNKGSYKKGTIDERLHDLLNIKDIKEFFIVTSVATLRACHKEKYKDKNGKEQTKKDYYLSNVIEQLCTSGDIGRIILDESQVFKNIDSDQTKALLQIQSCDYKIAATGTPLMNKHIDLYPLMKWLGYENGNYWSFRERYCQMGGFKNKQIIGNKNGDILNRKLKTFMLRRKKDTVLDLPEKIIIDEILEMDLKQQVFYNKTKGILKHQISQMKGNKAIILSMLTKLRQITCHPAILDPDKKDSVKFERIMFLMNEIVENNQKAIIFSNWSTPIDMLTEQLKMYNPAVITGATKDRMKQVNKFQQDDNCKVILGTIGAMGTGLTLTAANNVIFLDEPWNRALKDQATDRAHRIGTKNNVNIYTLICKGTIDEKVHNTVIKKGMIADEVVDGITAEELEEWLD